ncbi:MAG: DNA ligase, partial [Promethearchaeota archaeon]
MIDILSNFFKEIKLKNDYDELDKIIYLLQGQLVSNIKQLPKMGIAEKMIIEALSLHSGINKTKIKQILVKKGDIGATAELILKKKNDSSKIDSIEITELYAELKKIAKTGGSGSHDVKLGILRGLMKDPLETKYLLRIITSTLRVGVSTQTIIDGLAVGFTGTKDNRDYIENAYNLHPDLGEVTTILALKGLEEIKKI